MRSKLLISVLVACLALSICGLAYAAGLTDITGHWAQPQIDKLVTAGAVYGYADGTFQPDKQVNRAEFAAMVNNAFKKFDKNAKADFSDVTEADWFYTHVASAKATGYIKGDPNNTFRPNDPINRAEVASIMAQITKLETSKTDGLSAFTDAESIPSWARGSVAAVVYAKIMNGYTDGSFKPCNAITRAEAVVAIDKAMSYKAPVVVPPVVKNTHDGGGGSSSGGGSNPAPIVYLSNLTALKAEFSGTFLYGIKGDVASAVYEIQVKFGESTTKGVITDGKLDWGVAVADGTLTTATVIAKAQNGTVLETKTITFTSRGQQVGMSGLEAKKNFGDGYFHITGNVGPMVTGVEITIGGNTFIVVPQNGAFAKDVPIEGTNATSVAVKVKVGDVVVSTITQDFTVISSPEQPDALTGLTGQKTTYAATTFYGVNGQVRADVTGVEVVIGEETYSITPQDGGFSFRKAIAGNFASATVKAKVGDVVAGTESVTFTGNTVASVFSDVEGTKDGSVYTLTGHVNSAVTGLEIVIGEETIPITPQEGQFELQREIGGNPASAAITAKIGDVVVEATTEDFTDITVVTGLEAKKKVFAGSTFYGVKGQVTSAVTSVDVVIGDVTYHAKLEDGQFSLDKAIDGDYTSATVNAKTGETVIATKTVEFVVDVKPDVLSNIEAKKTVWGGSTFYGVQGNVTIDADRVEVKIGDITYTADITAGKFELGKAIDGDYASATVYAKAGGSVIATKTVDFAVDVKPDVLSNIEAKKTVWGGSTFYGVQGNVTTDADSVEVKIGDTTYTADITAGKFELGKAIDGDYVSATVYAKAGGTVIAFKTVDFAVDVKPAVFSNVVAKKNVLGGSNLYGVRGTVTSDVASVEVTIGDQTFTATPTAGQFEVSKALVGEFTSATLTAKAADGTVLATMTAPIVVDGGTVEPGDGNTDPAPGPVITVETKSKSDFFGAYAYIIAGTASADVAKVDLVFGSVTKTVSVVNGRFHYDTVLDTNYNSVTIKAKADDGTILDSITVNFDLLV